MKIVIRNQEKDILHILLNKQEKLMTNIMLSKVKPSFFCNLLKSYLNKTLKLKSQVQSFILKQVEQAKQTFFYRLMKIRLTKALLKKRHTKYKKRCQKSDCTLRRPKKEKRAI